VDLLNLEPDQISLVEWASVFFFYCHLVRLDQRVQGLIVQTLRELDQTLVEIVLISLIELSVHVG
jgi:hypothetical protein